MSEDFAGRGSDDFDFAQKALAVQDGFVRALNDGSACSEFTLAAVGSDLEISGGEMKLLFSYGVNGLIEALFERHLKELDLRLEGGVTLSVQRAVLSSFEILMPNLKAARAIAKFMASPANLAAGVGVKFFWRMADAIWKGLGINDSGFAYYSKRTILSGIYATCFAAFLGGQNYAKLLEKELSLLHKLSFKK